MVSIDTSKTERPCDGLSCSPDWPSKIIDRIALLKTENSQQRIHYIQNDSHLINIAGHAPGIYGRCKLESHCYFHKVGERVGLHFLHHLSSMCFNSSLANA